MVLQVTFSGMCHNANECFHSNDLQDHSISQASHEKTNKNIFKSTISETIASLVTVNFLLPTLST